MNILFRLSSTNIRTNTYQLVFYVKREKYFMQLDDTDYEVLLYAQLMDMSKRALWLATLLLGYQLISLE